ncbi:HlyC/CorC family transporter [Dichelobacter nodosus]
MRYNNRRINYSLTSMNDEFSGSKSSWLKKLALLLTDKTQPENPQDAFHLLLDDYRHNQTINDDTATMMESLLELNHTHVRDVMIPRGQMVVIHEHWSLDKVLSVIIQSGHSRYPVIDESHEKILGILITKDLLPILVDDDENPNFMAVIRSATVVPESKPLDAMLRDFRTNRNHMAIVIDEYGNLSGLVTIEDVIEEIVGEIDDEHDQIPDAEIRTLPDGSYQVKALMMIEHFNEQFQTHLPDEDADTIGGYLLHYFGRIPINGERLSIDGWEIIVSKANQRRILQLKVVATNEEHTEKAEE